MSTFQDNLNRKWRVEVTVRTVKRVRDLVGVDLYEAADGDLVDRIAADPCLLCDVICAVVRPQVEEAGLTDEDFAEGLGGDALDKATEALLAGLAEFYPEQMRHRLRAAMAKRDRALKEINRIVIGKLEDQTIEREIVQRINDEIDRRLSAVVSSDWSGALPVSSESTRKT